MAEIYTPILKYRFFYLMKRYSAHIIVGGKLCKHVFQFNYTHTNSFVSFSQFFLLVLTFVFHLRRTAYQLVVFKVNFTGYYTGLKLFKMKLSAPFSIAIIFVLQYVLKEKVQFQRLPQDVGAFNAHKIGFGKKETQQIYRPSGTQNTQQRNG